MKFRGKLTATGQSALSQVITHLAKTRGASSKDRRFAVVNIKISPTEFTLGCSAMDDGSPETWVHLAADSVFDLIECESLREGNYIDMIASVENLLAAAKGLNSSTATEIRLRNKSGLAVLAFTYSIPQAYDPTVGGQAFVKAFYDVPISLRNPVAIPQLAEADLQFSFADLEGCRRSIETLKRAMGNKLEKCTLKMSPSANPGEGGQTVKVSISSSSPMTTMSIAYSGLSVLQGEPGSQGEAAALTGVITRPLSVTVATKRLLNMVNVSNVKLDDSPVIMNIESDDTCSLTWQNAGNDKSKTLHRLRIKPVKTTVTAKKNRGGHFELDTVTTWTTKDELNPQVHHYLRLDPLISHLKNSPRQETCQKQIFAWGKYIHDKNTISKLSGENYTAGVSDYNAPLFIGLVPDVLVAEGKWRMEGQQLFSNAPPEADLFAGQVNPALPEVRVSMWWNPPRKRFEIASVLEEYKFQDHYLWQSSRDSELKKKLNGITVPEGNPDRASACENLAKYGESCSNAPDSRAKETYLKLDSRADIETKAVDSVLVVLGYLTGWPDILEKYTSLA
ncbi:hypothetical protein FOL47_001324 [Perkinsus chesapeaki]|uniref:Uncharacterized protein n=1 Tax=Perkinsus chesapeaki TaxID=330153 RepID=A0A7J6MJW0_PERCH|nr:hypothetical protein FOL47_001324 [Perkinsus chesapeaki]